MLKFIKRISTIAVLCSATIACLVGTAAAQTRNAFLQPFGSYSPWNYPIGSGAVEATIPMVSSYYGGIMWSSWTTGIYQATQSTRTAKLYIYKGDLNSLLSNGTVLTTGNSAATENALRANSQSTDPYVCNHYSTVVPSPPNPWTPPTIGGSGGVNSDSSNWTNKIYVPTNAYPSPDSDAHLAIMQPNGLFLECYGAVLCANGDIVCEIASFTDPTAAVADGTQNGRVASLLDDYAGKIRIGEIASGYIPHALACTVPPGMLTNTYIDWPARTMDTNDGYGNASGAVPMGALLTLPSWLNIYSPSLGLSPTGQAIAWAIQNYGAYVVDRGGSNGISFQAQLGDTEANYGAASSDMTIIVHNLVWVQNNAWNNVGGGGTPFQPFAPPL